MMIFCAFSFSRPFGNLKRRQHGLEDANDITTVHFPEGHATTPLHTCTHIRGVTGTQKYLSLTDKYGTQNLVTFNSKMDLEVHMRGFPKSFDFIRKCVSIHS